MDNKQVIVAGNDTIRIAGKRGAKHHKILGIAAGNRDNFSRFDDSALAAEKSNDFRRLRRWYFKLAGQVMIELRQ